jgi:serine O-acetyltransferase
LKNAKPLLFYIFYRLFVFTPFSRKIGVSIGPNCFGPGLYFPHPIGVMVHSQAKIGSNCKIQQGVTIGQTSGTQQVAKIGDNVFIGAWAKNIGGITIADRVAIGANAVVCKGISKKNTTWGGVPARKISNNGSHAQLSKDLHSSSK